MKRIAIIMEGGNIQEVITSEATEVVIVDRDGEGEQKVLGVHSYVYGGITSGEVNETKLQQIFQDTNRKYPLLSNENNEPVYYNEAVTLYKKLLRETKGGTMYHLENIFRDEVKKDEFLSDVVEENDLLDKVERVGATWVKNDQGSYHSHHILEIHLGDEKPKYHVLKNPDGEGWVIGIFFGFIGEYAPLEEEDEERLTFPTAAEAMNYVDSKLNQGAESE